MQLHSLGPSGVLIARQSGNAAPRCAPRGSTSCTPPTPDAVSVLRRRRRASTSTGTSGCRCRA
jgi:hypothetical protein